MSTQPRTDVERIIEMQRRWAETTSRRANRHGTGLVSRNEALIVPLPAEVESQLASAPGGELDRIHSFRSSSALALNVFLPWNERPEPVALVLGGSGDYGQLSFETPYDTGISKPYLDVVIRDGDLVIAIESKFVEPYDDRPRSTFNDRYFASPDIWRPFPDLEPLAAHFSKVDRCFERIDAAQLLKHAMGLINAYGATGFELLYLWYEMEGLRASQHRTDIADFSALVSSQFSFRAITYQDLFVRLSSLDEPMRGYLEYLSRRYFPGLA